MFMSVLLLQIVVWVVYLLWQGVMSEGLKAAAKDQPEPNSKPATGNNLDQSICHVCQYIGMLVLPSFAVLIIFNLRDSMSHC